MHTLRPFFFGERSVTKLAGLFASRGAAESAWRALLVGHAGLTAAQLRLLGPEDGTAARGGDLGRAVIPEERGMVYTLVVSHVSMAGVGALAGAALYAALMAWDNAALRSTPLMGLVALVGFGATFGLFLGGLIALRPDQTLVLRRVREALQAGQWAVVVHPVDADQTRQAIDALNGGSLEVVRSF